MKPLSVEDGTKKCYLCEIPLGMPYALACEKGPDIIVCEDCWDEARSEANYEH